MTKQEKWEKTINEFMSSGLSQRKWCSTVGIDRNRLQYWLLRLEYLSLGDNVEFTEVITGGD